MDSPVSLSKADDAQYQQQQNHYEQQQQLIIQQQQMVIQQQQSQLYSQQRNLEELQLAQQKLEQQQIELQQLQYEKAQLQSNQFKAQLEAQQQQIDQQQLAQYQQQAYQQSQQQQIVGNGSIAVINPTLDPCEIVNGCLHAPSGSEFIGDQTRGNIKVRIIRATNLMSADINNSSDPYVKIKSSCFNHYPQTKVINKTLNPIWEETFFLTIESVRTELLMFKVYDHDLVGCDDLLGYFGVNLSLLPMGIEMKTTENLYYAKHGQVEIAITALDFGLTNIPTNYISTYQKWRNELKVLPDSKSFKSLPSSKHFPSYLSKRDIEMGPYYCKIAHPDFKIEHGFVKLRKTSRAKFVDGLATAGLITVAVFAVILTAPFSGCNHRW